MYLPKKYFLAPARTDLGVKLLRLTATSNCFPHPYWRCVWAHWYAVHRYTVAALHSCILPTLLRLWGSGSGVVYANVWQNVTPHNPSLGLFSYHFLHLMRSWRHKLIYNNSNNQQTPPLWWWSHLPLQQHRFNESMPSEWWAALRVFVPRPPSKGFGRINKSI